MLCPRAASIAGKVIETIDLSQDFQTELPKLVHHSKRVTVFFTYAKQYREIAERIRRALQAAGWHGLNDVRRRDVPLLVRFGTSSALGCWTIERS